VQKAVNEDPTCTQETAEAMSSCQPPSFNEAVRTWAYIGLNSFGGPAGQIAVMHRVLIDEKKWISEHRFLHALNYCMLLPGPEAQQLAIYIGWLFHGVRGGLVAGILFVLPGVLAILGLSYLYVGFHEVHFVQSLFFGLKAAVLAIVAEAVLRIGRRALKSRWQVVVAGLAFVAIFFLNLPFPLIVASAAALGLIQARRAHHRGADAPGQHQELGKYAVDDLLDASEAHRTFPALSHVFRVLSIWGTLWLAPVGVLLLILGPDSVYFRISSFFSQAAVVTFGGAYSVLAYIAQAAVERFHWLQPGEMLDGLAMAETTPGPLIMVVQFVGFVAAARNAGTLHPMLAGTLGALITTWVTFAPCFLWIFLGAPYIEALRHNRALNGALSAITAAVVGVVLNLAVWFAIHTIFTEVDELHFWGVRLLIPDWATVNWAALALAAAAMIATFRFHVGLLKVLGGCAIGGIVLQMMWP
jgi:chromate transporter